MLPPNRLIRALASLVLVLAAGSALAVDDTAVFGTPRAPNVVMINDTSGSMNEYVPARSVPYDATTSYPNACAFTERVRTGTRRECRAYDRRGNCTRWENVPVYEDRPVNLSSDYFYVIPKDKPGGYTYTTACENTANRDARTRYSDGWGPIAKRHFDGDARAEIEDKGYKVYGGDYYVLSMNYRNWVLGDAAELPRAKGYLLQKVLAGRDGSTGLLDNIDKVNIALMRFNTTEGGKVAHHVAKLDSDRYASLTASNRTSLKQAVNEFTFDNWTPLTESLYESYRYYQGETPVYGGGSVAAAMSGGRYRTPLTASCDANFVILLTDGQPTQDQGADARLASAYRTRGGRTCAGPSGGESVADSCLDNLAAQMAGQDFLPDTGSHPLRPGRQSIKVSTIGFDIDSPLLRDTAASGGGIYGTAGSYAELLAALEAALGNVAAASASFAPAGVTVNQANQLRHSDELYYALFQSAQVYHWQGNLKKFKLGGDGGIYGLDRSGRAAAAVDGHNNFLSDVADHFAASLTEEGVGAVAKGGAVSRLPLGSDSRRVYTDLTGSGTALASNAALGSLSDGLLAGNSVYNVADPTARRYALGLDADGARQQVMGDPLHSEPHYLRHDGTTATVFVGTNDGYLHAVDAANGTERFAFLPSGLFVNLPRLISPNRYTGRTYGLDGPITSYFQDGNGNGRVESGDRAIVYVGMRRGGDHNPARNAYYALDVSDLAAPRLLFTVDHGRSGYGQLAQTWSPMKLVDFKHGPGGSALKALVFGGGYDKAFDDNGEPRSESAVGNRIYIADPLSGALLASFSTDYAVPSEVRAVDLDGNGYADTLYAVDIKGNLYRWQLRPGQTSLTDASFTGGKLATLSGSGNQARRFFYAPEAALMKRDNQQFVVLAVGSGDRENPLDESRDPLLEDGIFLLWDKGARRFQDLPTLPVVYTELADVTDNVVAEGGERSAVSAVDTGGKGWRIRLNHGSRRGEKILSSPLVSGGRIFLTSFVPGAEVACSSVQGGGRLYVLSLLDGRPVFDLDTPPSNDPNVLSLDDRSQETGIPGINTTPVQVLPPPPESGPAACTERVLINNRSICIGGEGELVQHVKWRRN